MAPVRYEQVSTKPEAAEVADPPPNHCFQRAFRSLLLILLYFTLSISLTFYQRWLLKGFHFPLSVVVYHLVVKFCLSALIRGILYLYTGTPRVALPFFTSLRCVAPTGIASGIDVSFSNWALELVTISLYTMTKSTTIIFILGFAILLGLEKKSWSLVMIVVMISTGLTMFTYKATQFDTFGFALLIMASLASGLRWTFAQVLMQKSKLGLNNPLDIVYYVQPWMLLSVLPLLIGFEGLQLIENMLSLPTGEILPCVFKVSFGAFLAFAMELSEYLVVTHTSSLTLSIAGIFKEMFILILAVEINGDEMSRINVLGLIICLIGITGHIIHKFYVNSTAQTLTTTINYTSRITEGFFVQETLDTMKGFEGRDLSLFRRNTSKGKSEHSVPLLADQDTTSTSINHAHDEDQSLDSDGESNKVIFDILQRRDIVR
ncbi:solute carrier family 35 member C2 [Arctopsyche grandis]|uniref:solute carrier family 35 member C2 n=1 Tax=Arctopsyche grandis TaxID=121162 RepID=UPI00406D9C30